MDRQRRFNVIRYRTNVVKVGLVGSTSQCLFRSPSSVVLLYHGGVGRREKARSLRYLVVCTFQAANRETLIATLVDSCNCRQPSTCPPRVANPLPLSSLPPFGDFYFFPYFTFFAIHVITAPFNMFHLSPCYHTPLSFSALDGVLRLPCRNIFRCALVLSLMYGCCHIVLPFLSSPCRLSIDIGRCNDRLNKSVYALNVVDM